MLKKVVLAAAIAASSLVALPAAAQYPPIPPCSVNCVFISTDHEGNGYWVCEAQMDCVDP